MTPAKAKTPAPEEAPARIRVGVHSLEQRHRQYGMTGPGPRVIATAADAEAARGGEGDLIIISTPAGAARDVLELLDTVLDVERPR